MSLTSITSNTTEVIDLTTIDSDEPSSSSSSNSRSSRGRNSKKRRNRDLAFVEVIDLLDDDNYEHNHNHHHQNKRKRSRTNSPILLLDSETATSSNSSATSNDHDDILLDDDSASNDQVTILVDGMSEKRRGKQIVQPKRKSSKSSSDAMDDEEIEIDETQFYLNQGFKRGECLICYSEEQILIPLIHSSCSHSFCLQCLRTYCTDKLSSHSVPIPCPMGSQCCSTQEADDGLLGASTNLQRKQQTMIHELDLKIIFTPIQLSLYHDYMIQRFMEQNPNQFSSCLTPDCNMIFAYDGSSEEDHDCFCPKCKNRYCLKCQCDYHVNITCQQYQQWKRENSTTDDKFQEYIEKSGSKQCPQCKRYIQKSLGCDHMTCKCGCQFCYRCGGSYPCRNRSCGGLITTQFMGGIRRMGGGDILEGMREQLRRWEQHLSLITNRYTSTGATNRENGDVHTASAQQQARMPISTAESSQSTSQATEATASSSIAPRTRRSIRQATSMRSATTSSSNAATSSTLTPSSLLSESLLSTMGWTSPETLLAQREAITRVNRGRGESSGRNTTSNSSIITVADTGVRADRGGSNSVTELSSRSTSGGGNNVAPALIILD